MGNDLKEREFTLRIESNASSPLHMCLVLEGASSTLACVMMEDKGSTSPSNGGSSQSIFSQLIVLQNQGCRNMVLRTIVLATILI